MFIARTLGDGKRLRVDDYGRTFGTSLLDDHGGTIARLRDGGLLDSDASSVGLTETGKLAYDLVTLAFYPQPAKDWLLGRLESYQVA
jgi:hypothetical protein